MPLKIYYLDDETALCENFFDYFSSSEFEITTFTDPKLAMEAVIKRPPDLIFIDYRLSGTTGDEVALALNPSLPKYLITGDIALKTKYPFERVFSKPYPENEMRAFLENFLSKKAPLDRY